MGGGDLVSEGGLGWGRLRPETDWRWGQELVGVGVGNRGNAALFVMWKGAVALESERITKATKGRGGHLGRCARCVASGGKWCCVFVGGDTPIWKFWKGPGSGSCNHGKKANIEDGACRPYFI